MERRPAQHRPWRRHQLAPAADGQRHPGARWGGGWSHAESDAQCQQQRQQRQRSDRRPEPQRQHRQRDHSAERRPGRGQPGDHQRRPPADEPHLWLQRRFPQPQWPIAKYPRKPGCSGGLPAAVCRQQPQRGDRRQWGGVAGGQPHGHGRRHVQPRQPGPNQPAGQRC